MNIYLADDGFSVFTEGTDRTGSMTDLEALESHFANSDEVAPGSQGRTERLDWWTSVRRRARVSAGKLLEV